MDKKNRKDGGQLASKRQKQAAHGKIATLHDDKSHKTKFEQLLDDAVIGIKKK